MTDDIEERAVLARRGIMDHSDCEDCVEDWTFLMRQGRREFPLGLRTVLACLAFAEREGAVPELPAEQADDLDGIVAQRAHRVVGRPRVAVTTPRGHAAGAPHV